MKKCSLALVMVLSLTSVSAQLVQQASKEDLIEKLTPDFPIFSKRIILDNGWFDALARPGKPGGLLLPCRRLAVSFSSLRRRRPRRPPRASAQTPVQWRRAEGDPHPPGEA